MESFFFLFFITNMYFFSRIFLEFSLPKIFSNNLSFTLFYTVTLTWFGFEISRFYKTNNAQQNNNTAFVKGELREIFNRSMTR